MPNMEDKRHIFRLKPQSGYIKLKKSTIKKIILGDRPNAYQIWMWALSCKYDFKITADIISEKFRISRRTAVNHINLLIKNNLVKRVSIRDKEKGYYIEIFYKFYERPFSIESEFFKYREKLKLPLWQKKRLEILQRDNWTCQECGDNKTTLTVHHIEYVDNFEPWDYPDNLLITLCEECHKEKHANNSN